jgi:hypothetical protein
MRHSDALPLLDPADYRNVFAVLEGLADSVGSDDFFERFRGLLAARLGWTDTLIVDVPARLGRFPARETAMDHFHSNRSSAYLEEYLDRWYMKNPFKTARARVLLDRWGEVSLRDLQAYSTVNEWAFVDRYLHRHRITDVLNGQITGRSGGVLIYVYFGEGSALRERDRVIMQHLHRYLGTWVGAHFSRSGSRVRASDVSSPCRR